jgi:hypothetical protein
VEETPGAAAVGVPPESGGRRVAVLREAPFFAASVAVGAWLISKDFGLGAGGSLAAATPLVAALWWVAHRRRPDELLSPWTSAGVVGSLLAGLAGFLAPLAEDGRLPALATPLLWVGLWLAVLLGLRTVLRVLRWPR